MSHVQKGVIHIVEPITERSPTFQTRTFVLEIPDEKYPQYAAFQLIQDRCDIVQQGDEGQPVEVYFDIRGREWNGKYLTNLQAWKVEGVVRAEDSEQSEDLPF